MKRKKAARVDKPQGKRFLVMDRTTGKLKYPPALGQEPTGFTEDIARRLAEPAHETHDFILVPVDEA